MSPFEQNRHPETKRIVTDRIIAATILPLIPRIVTPNEITATRFTATPFVIYLLAIGQYAWGLVLFALTVFTDAVDGALARTRGPITTWGKMYDPLADKLLIGSVAAIMVTRFLSQWVALLIISFELFLVIGAFIWRKYHGVEIRAQSVGKIKMVLQSVGVGFVLLYALMPMPFLIEIARYLLYGAIAFAALSLFVYRSI